ncbi:nucleotide sugar dehydrogenase [Marisediminicola senii]|uniref:nucleotide sugar dehydrogenase n=1 Tax=Marisediminicola senii TaxID=2711233 RepID=UPI001F2AAAAC|nr:nucleotide sugar dehydrogenase [Marisediminicola senii]
MTTFDKPPVTTFQSTIVSEGQAPAAWPTELEYQASEQQDLAPHAGDLHDDFAFDVAIVGLGYVGLPTALAYHNAGNRVLAVDISQHRLDTIRSRDADLLAPDRIRLDNALDDPGFVLTNDPWQLERAAAIIVCVPTPVDAHLVPDLRILRSACAMVIEHAQPGQLTMLTSTSYVGCTEDLLVRPLEEQGFTIGEDIFVAFSAERINPGNDDFSIDVVPRVVGGATAACQDRAATLLHRYTASVHLVRSLAAAEMTKLLENTFRAVNIALANEFADICRALDVTVTDVIDAAATKPYGFMPFTPGPGVGGHCIPCDPHYLLWQLRKEHISAPMITQAMTEIAERPTKVVDRVREVLSGAGLGMTGARVLVVGVSYKPDVADLRESPALEIIETLAQRGATVGYVDPHFASLRLPGGEQVTGVIDPASFSADLILLHTRHGDQDLSWITPEQLVIDGTYRGIDLPQRVLL